MRPAGRAALGRGCRPLSGLVLCPGTGTTLDLMGKGRRWECCRPREELLGLSRGDAPPQVKEVGTCRGAPSAPGQRRRGAGPESSGRNGGARKDSVVLVSSASRVLGPGRAPPEGRVSGRAAVGQGEEFCTDASSGRRAPAGTACAPRPCCRLPIPAARGPLVVLPGTGAAPCRLELRGPPLRVWADHGPGVCCFGPFNQNRLTC